MKPQVFFIIILGLITCSKDEIQKESPCGEDYPYDKIYCLQFTLDKAAQNVSITTSDTDTEIQYEDVNYPTAIDGDRLIIKIPNVSIKDGNSNYYSTCFKIEEYDDSRDKSDRWFSQSEFNKELDSFKTITATALCIDVSSSLGLDREKVKLNAIAFAKQYFLNSKQSYISLTFFEDKVVTLPLTNKLADIESAISSYDYPDINSNLTSTQLFDGLINGIHVLDTTNLPVTNKVIVMFTDGNDSGSGDEVVKKSKIESAKYKKYFIGLEGKGDEYNPKLLNELSDEFVETDDANKLGDKFDEINELIASIYTIVYNRKNILLDTEKKLRVLFYSKKLDL